MNTKKRNHKKCVFYSKTSQNKTWTLLNHICNSIGFNIAKVQNGLSDEMGDFATKNQKFNAAFTYN